MRKPKPANPVGMRLLLERIARGGDLDPVQLSRSFNIPTADIQKILNARRLA